MAVRSDITVEFDLSPRIITVAAPSTALSIQDLVDTLRGIEGALDSMSYFHLTDAAGKNDLGGGSFVGITISLRDAEVAFEARLGPAFELCTVSGGNLTAVGTDGITPIDPIHPTAYTTVVITQSSSPTIINADNAALWTAPIENGKTAEEMWRLMYSAMVGVVSGADSNTMTFLSDDELKSRIIATVDAVGNRTAVTKDGSE